MKQYIDASQLAELTDEQKAKLKDWWQPKAGDVCHYYGGWEFDVVVQSIHKDPMVPTDPPRPLSGEFAHLDNHLESVRSVKRNALPLLSVGQMVELLKPHLGYIVPGDGKLWIVNLRDSRDALVSKELVDVLWDALKAVL